MWVAIDLGATKLAVRAAFGAHVVEERLLLPSGSAAQEVDAVVAFVRDVLARHQRGRIYGAALAAAPSFDEQGSVASWPNRAHWHGQELLPRIEGIVGVPLVVEDDGNAAALAEADALGIDELVYIGLGTGVAGGVVTGGCLHRGFGGHGGQLGHVVVDMFGPPCRCGARGCVQSVASGPATVARASRLRRRRVGPLELRRHLDAGDRWAASAIQASAAALAALVASIGELLAPEIIAIGGGFGVAFPEIVGGVRDLVSSSSQRRAAPLVCRAQHGRDSSLAGAALLAATACHAAV